MCKFEKEVESAFETEYHDGESIPVGAYSQWPAFKAGWKYAERFFDTRAAQKIAESPVTPSNNARDEICASCSTPGHILYLVTMCKLDKCPKCGRKLTPVA
jgi:hypothetical protein